MRTSVVATSTLVALVASMAAAAPAGADPDPPTSYVVLMSEAPAVAYDGSTASLRSTQPAPGEQFDPDAPGVEAYVDHLAETHTEVLADAGITSEPVNSFTYAANGFSALLTEDEAERLRLHKGVLNVREDVLRQKQTDVSGEFLGLDGRRGAWNTGLTGEGVVVGVIDTGIWPEHPSFADDGTLARPDGVPDDLPCEFGDTAHNAQDAAFDCQNKLLGARDMRTTYKELVGPDAYNSARDSDGHGTHTASTAAGDAGVHAEIFGIDRGTVSGIAPRASVIAYKALGDSGGFTSDLAAAIDQAVADGVDVINYSVGSATPGLTSADDIAFLFAAEAGVHVAASAGNEGPGASTIGSPAAVPWVTTVAASTHDRAFEATLTLGPDNSRSSHRGRHHRPRAQQYTGASLTEALGTTPLVDAEDRGNPLCLVDTPFDPALNGEIVLCLRGENARVEKSRAVLEQGGAGMVLYNTTDAEALVTDNHWVPSVHISHSDGLAVKAYIDSTAEPTASLTEGRAAPTQGSVMADFSSRGPVAAPGSSDIIRPDVTAPGVNILAGNTPTPSEGRPGQLFQAISGTSMSSPEVAGLLALLDQAHPDWSPAIAKSALMTTARQDVTKEDGQTRADPFDMGAGHVDPGKPGRKGSMFDPGIAYDSGFLDHVAFLCGAAEGAVAPDECSTLVEQGYSTDAAQLNLPSIGDASVTGTGTITRTVTNVSDERLHLKASVRAPRGFTIDVEPSRLRLAPGESAEFQLTITNRSSEVGAWKFGSLTWYGGGYEARSPIALQGTAIDAPDEVAVTGESGTGSFDVDFGYTGEYSVDAHGLAAEVLTPGSVGQDPDTVFAPTDVGNGATLHEVDLTDAAFYRLVLNQDDVTGPNAADVDLDVYVFGPDGSPVASSGAPGTNEVIELSDPAPGVYQVYVHGWGTGGQTVGYTLRSWTVPATPNAGTLQVTSAPVQAVTATSGTVEFAWSGVAPGTTELGLLIHRDTAGVIARTLVEVTG